MKFYKMTLTTIILICTIIAFAFTFATAVLQLIKQSEDSKNNEKIAIANENKQKEISDIQRELIKKSNQLQDKTDELLSLNSKLQQSNELVVKLQSDQKHETQRLQSPINDKFKVSFQIWFYNKKYFQLLNNALNAKPDLHFFSLYPFEINNCNVNEVNSAVEDLMKRLNRSSVTLNFKKANLNFQPLSLFGEINLQNKEFLKKGQYNLDETNNSPYKFISWLTYNQGENFFRLDIQNLPLRILFQHHSIISLNDLNALDLEIKVIDIRDYNHIIDTSPTFELENIQIHFVHFECGNRMLSPIREPQYNSETNSFTLKDLRIEE